MYIKHFFLSFTHFQLPEFRQYQIFKTGMICHKAQVLESSGNTYCDHQSSKIIWFKWANKPTNWIRLIILFTFSFQIEGTWNRWDKLIRNKTSEYKSSRIIDKNLGSCIVRSLKPCFNQNGLFWCKWQKHRSRLASVLWLMRLRRTGMTWLKVQQGSGTHTGASGLWLSSCVTSPAFCLDSIF